MSVTSCNIVVFILQVLSAARQARTADVAALAELAEKAAKLSGSGGIKQISDQLSEAQLGWCESAWKTEKTLESLTTMVATLESFDWTFDEMNAWLSTTEGEVKRHKLATSVDEQKIMINSLMARILYPIHRLYYM